MFSSLAQRTAGGGARELRLASSKLSTIALVAWLGDWHPILALDRREGSPDAVGCQFSEIQLSVQTHHSFSSLGKQIAGQGTTRPTRPLAGAAPPHPWSGAY